MDCQVTLSKLYRWISSKIVLMGTAGLSSEHNVYFGTATENCLSLKRWAKGHQSYQAIEEGKCHQKV